MEVMDTSRFHLTPPPASKQNDFSAWRAATDNAHSQLEHQYNRWAVCIPAHMSPSDSAQQFLFTIVPVQLSAGS